MNNLDEIVQGFYGQSLVRTQAIKWNVHHLYALYEHVLTKEKLFLRLIELPAFLHISEEIAELYNKKYGNILTPLQIIPVDRNFQSCLYLVRTPNNNILLSIYLAIIIDCDKSIDLHLFVGIFSFIIKSYELLKDNKLPLYDASQIGLSESLELSLCDPSLYFKSMKIQNDQPEFGVWLAKLIRQLLKIPKNQEQVDEFLKNIILENDLITLIKQILKENYTFEQFVEKTTVISKISQDVTTVTSSSIDIVEYYQRKNQESLLVQSNHAKADHTFKSKLGRIIIGFIVLMILLACSYFLMRYFTRTIICGQSQYLSENKMCLGCSDGCLRCQNSEPNHCMKCKNNMYLVLDDAEDKVGFCLTECRGRLIKIDVCIKYKFNEIEQKGTQQSGLERVLQKGRERVQKAREMVQKVRDRVQKVFQ